MSAVLILAGSHAIPVSFTTSILAFGVVIAAMLSAVWQWVASAQATKDRVKRFAIVLAGTLGVYFTVAWDCGDWQWVCNIFI